MKMSTHVALQFMLQFKDLCRDNSGNRVALEGPSALQGQLQAVLLF